jgi:hypothetical protein
VKEQIKIQTKQDQLEAIKQQTNNPRLKEAIDKKIKHLDKPIQK